MSYIRDIYGIPTYEEYRSSARQAWENDKFTPEEWKSRLQSFDIIGLLNRYKQLTNEPNYLADYNEKYGYMNEKIADNELAALETENARQFSEYMEGTKYQRLVKDLEAAGINPLYAVNGASATPGNSVSTTATNMASTSTARDEMRLNREMTESNIRLNKMQGVASIIGAIAQFAGAVTGAATGFGITTPKRMNFNNSQLVSKLGNYVVDTIQDQYNDYGQRTGSVRTWTSYKNSSRR